jgi:hypothetical protein
MTEVIITVTSSGVTLTVQQGQPGVGVPAGGDIGQTLVKLSNDNYDTGWASAFAGGVTEVATGSGLTGGPITSTGTVSIDFYSSNNWYGYAAFNGDFEIAGPTFNNSAALTAFSYQTIFYGPTEQRGTVLIRPSDVAPVAGQVLGAADTTGNITWITPNSGSVTSITPAGDNGAGTAITTSGTITIAGTANEVTTSVTGTTVTVGLPDSITVLETNADRFDFNTTPTATDAIGRMYWDTTYGTPTIGLSSTVQQKMGHTLFKRARNGSNSITINKGDVVYISGSHALTELMVELADADNESSSADTVGVAAETIAPNTSGLIQVFGFITGLTTNGYSGAEGTPLYLGSTPGQMQSTLPTQPKHGVRVAFLAKKAGGGAGSIFVNIQNYQELEELSDVLVSGQAEQDLLSWDNTTLVWRNRTRSAAGVASTATTISANSGLTGGGDLSANRTISIATSGVTYAKIQDTSAASVLIGRGSLSGAGAVQELTTGTGLNILGTVLSCDVPGVTINTQEFTSSGTWTKPTNAKMVFIRCIGGGAGGSGATTASGGASGGAGQTAELWIPASVLSSNETVSIGAAGTGGAAGTTNNGGGGGVTQFGPILNNWVFAVGGNGSNSLFVRTNEGVSATAAFGGGNSAGSQGRVGRFNGSGGGGGGASGGATAGASGGQGGQGTWAGATTVNTGGGAAGGSAGGTPGVNGSAGTVGVSGYGDGGGGGGGSITTTGGNGGAGIRGSGGGGGGRGNTAGGAGGAGGVGYCVVYTICG